MGDLFMLLKEIKKFDKLINQIKKKEFGCKEIDQI